MPISVRVSVLVLLSVCAAGCYWIPVIELQFKDPTGAPISDMAVQVTSGPGIEISPTFIGEGEDAVLPETLPSTSSPAGEFAFCYWPLYERPGFFARLFGASDPPYQSVTIRCVAEDGAETSITVKVLPR